MAAVLFVCLGNICRSPLAEGIFRAKATVAGVAERITIDSAGTSGWHLGNPPDARSVAVARRHGIDLTGLRARKVTVDDFRRFTHILAMDASNLRELSDLAPVSHPALLLRFLAQDVPDPYYGDDDGFDQIFHMLSQGCEALLADLIERM